MHMQPDPFNTVEPKTFTFKARVELIEQVSLQMISNDIRTSQQEKFQIGEDECHLSNLNWVPKEVQSDSVPMPATLDIVIGPIQTDNSMDKISVKVRTGLVDHSDCCAEVHNVTCVDIIP